MNVKGGERLRLIWHWWLSLGLLVLPLVWWPKAAIIFELPRVWWVKRFTEVLVGLGLVGLGFLVKSKRINGRLVKAVLWFFLIAVLASALGVDWNKSVWGNFYRQDGLVTLAYLLAFFLIVVLVIDKSWWQRLALVIVTGSLLTSAWTVSQGARLYLFKDLSVRHWQGAIGASFGQPVFLAGYLVVSLPFLMYWFQLKKQRWWRWLWALLLLVQLVAIGLTRSLLNLELVVVTGGLWLALEKDRLRLKLRWALGLGLALGLGIGLIFLIGMMISRNQSQLGERRERILNKGWLGYIQRPVLGWGVANFDYAFEAVDWPEKYNHDVYVDKAHSSLFEVLVTMGVVGLGVYLVVIGLALRSLGQRQGKIYQYYFLTLIVLLIQMQTNVVSVAQDVLWWLVVAAAAEAR